MRSLHRALIKPILTRAAEGRRVSSRLSTFSSAHRVMTDRFHINSITRKKMKQKTIAQVEAEDRALAYRKRVAKAWKGLSHEYWRHGITINLGNGWNVTKA